MHMLMIAGAVADFDSSGHVHPRGDTKQAIKHSSGHSKHSGVTSKGGMW